MTEEIIFHFELWHLPIVFLAGLVAEFYGCMIGGGSILIQAVLLALGLPIQNVIATDTVGVIGSDLGAMKETRQDIKKHWKMVCWMSLPLLVGGVIGSHLLIHTSPVIIKNIIIVLMVFLLIYYAISRQKKNSHIHQSPIHIMKYIFLVIFLLSIGVYNNFIGVGEGVFMRIAMMTMLSLPLIGVLGLKMAAMLPARIYALVITSLNGLLFFPYLITLWISTFIAGVYSIRFAKKVPEKYLRRFLIIAAIIYLGYLILY